MKEDTIKRLLANQKNLESVLDNLKEGIIAHDLNRVILFFNREAERITGYKKDEVLGRDCHKVFGRPFCGGNCSFGENRLKISGKTEYPVTIPSKKGNIKHLSMNVTPMKDEDGRLTGVLASFMDATELIDLKLRAAESDAFADIIGRHPAMLNIFQQIVQVAQFDYPVHIFGETGTGKELVAAAIHRFSRRSNQAFVPINCGALPEDLIETELFGHVRGSFSGAITNKRGRFELAHGGTAFLDEISDISPHVQVKLLRFLQEGTFEKVGGEKTIKVDVRIISAANKDLKEEVDQGRFREDLYYRLNVIPISLPPLRERIQDIELLVDHFLKEFEDHYKKKAPAVSKDTIDLMMKYDWPGNVRELQNAVQFALVRCRNGIITPRDLPMEIRPENTPPQTGKLTPEKVAAALKRSGENKSKAAKILGIGRATLYRFLEKHPEILK